MPAPISTPAALELTFLGHQTWLISDGTTSVLLDPIVEQSFGAGNLEFRVWPPRTVDVAAMPAPAALVLSHEHLDHLHIPSLNRLDRAAPLYTGATVPVAVAAAVGELGFTVERRDHTTPIRVGNLEITLFPASGKTAFWGSRVVAPVVTLAGTDLEVLIGVDADISDLYLEELRGAQRPAPRMAVVSNNAQTVPFGALGADCNLLPGLDGPRNRTTGLEILHGLLTDYLRPVGPVPDVALCGNGFTAPRSPHGPFLYADHRALAAQANALQHLFTVHGPWPGDKLTVPVDGPVTCTQVPWITVDEAAEQAALAELDAFLAEPRQVEPTPITAPLPCGRWSNAQDLVAAELPRLARDLIATRTGALATKIHDYLSGPLNGHRLALRLLSPPGRPGDVACYAWDITGPALVEVPDAGRDDAMATYPFGVEIHFQDFVALLDGRAQIWDIIGGSYQGWFIGDALDSPVYALMDVYGEHRRPALAERCYRFSLDNLTSTPKVESAQAAR